jgi:hypothetical protein
VNKNTAPMMVNSVAKTDDNLISIVTACKNRNECLETVLPSWLQCKEIGEIIIVDWSSDIPLKHLTELDKRIKVIRINDEKYYIPSQANNLGVSLVTNNRILRLDVDHFLNPYYNFFEKYKIDETCFVTGAPENFDTLLVRGEQMKQSVNTSDKSGVEPFFKHLFGFLYITRDNLNKVNGYDENIGYYYSYEDGNLFRRLKLHGLKQIELKFEDFCVVHIPHSNKKRYEHFEGGQIEVGNDDRITVNYHYTRNLKHHKDPKQSFVYSKFLWKKQLIDNNYVVIDNFISEEKAKELHSYFKEEAIQQVCDITDTKLIKVDLPLATF